MSTSTISRKLQAEIQIGNAGSSNAGSNSRSSFRSAISALVERVSFFTGRFLLHDQRDINRIFRRKEKITARDMKKRRTRGIAKRIVSYHPQETWSVGFEVVESREVKNVTRFEKDVLDLVEEFDLVDIFSRLDEAANYGRYSCLLIGIGAEGEEVKFQDPITSNPANKLLYLRVLDETQCTILSLIKDRSNPQWGMPEFYQVSTADLDSPLMDSINAPKVHWSRIIHFCPNGLTSDIYGNPDLEAVWDYLDDIEKITGSSAEIFYRHAKMLLIASLKDGFNLSPDDPIVKKIEEELQEMEEGLRSNMMASGFDVKLLSAQVNKMQGAVEPLIDLVMGTLAISKRRFFGSEQGDMASGQDRKNDLARISKRRTRIGKKLVREFLERLFAAQVIRPPGVKKFEIVFGEEEELDLKEKAEVLKSLAAANQSQALARTGTLVISPQSMLDLVGIEIKDQSQNQNQDNQDQGNQDQGNQNNNQDQGSSIQPPGD